MQVFKIGINHDQFGDQLWLYVNHPQDGKWSICGSVWMAKGRWDASEKTAFQGSFYHDEDDVKRFYLRDFKPFNYGRTWKVGSKGTGYFIKPPFALDDKEFTFEVLRVD